jgi:hypothetical protein
MFASMTKTPVGVLPANSRRGACATSRGTWRRVWTPYSPSGLAAVSWAQLRRIEMSATDGAIAAPCAVFLRHGAWRRDRLPNDHDQGGRGFRRDIRAKTARIALVILLPGALLSAARTNGTSAYQQPHGGTSQSEVSTLGGIARVLRRCFSCSDAAARVPLSRRGKISTCAS